MAVNSERRTRRASSTSGRTSASEGSSRKANTRRKSADTARREGRKGSRRRKGPRISLRALGHVLRWGLMLGFAALLLFGAGTALLKVYHFCLTSPYFAITDITVKGNSQLKTDEILDLCGLKKGVSSLAVNVHEAEKRLLDNPWLESVIIRRELPGTFRVSVTERVPMFCARKEGTLYYVTAEGLIIEPVNSRNFRSLPVLEIGPGGEDSLPLVAEFAGQFRKAGFPFDLSQVSWMRVSAGGGFELYWESRRLHLGIGLEDWKSNMKRIASVVSDIEKRREAVMVSSIRAADGQVWMTRRGE